MTFDQKNIFGRLKLLANFSNVFGVVCRTKFYKKVRITVLTEKKLRLQIAGIVSSVYALIRLAHVTSSC